MKVPTVYWWEVRENVTRGVLGLLYPVWVLLGVAAIIAACGVIVYALLWVLSAVGIVSL